MKNRKGKKMKKTKVMAGILCAIALIVFSGCANALNTIFGFNDDEKKQTSITDNPLGDNTTGNGTQTPSDDDYYDDDVTHTVYVCKTYYQTWKSFIEYYYGSSQAYEIAINTGDGGPFEDSDDFYTLLSMLGTTTKEWSRRQIQTYLEGAGDPNAEIAAKEICSYADEYVFYIFRESETDAYYVLKTPSEVQTSPDDEAQTSPDDEAQTSPDDDGNDSYENYDKTRVFNVTTSISSPGSQYIFYEEPEWNVIFPPALKGDFTVYKGKVVANEFDESAAKTKGFENKIYDDYEDGYAYLIASFYVDSSHDAYLSPDDKGGYAYRIKSQKSGADDVVSDLIYPEDIVKIKCKKFDWEYGTLSWEFEFSKKPDSLYLVKGDGAVSYKSAWKFPAFITDSSYYTSYKELDSNSRYFGGMITIEKRASIFAKYGDYYVRITPVLRVK